MHKTNKNKMIAVVLKDITDSSLPRIIAIQSKVNEGNILSSYELNFVHHELNKVSRCYHYFENDEACQAIFSHFAHLLSEVVSVALENECKPL